MVDAYTLIFNRFGLNFRAVAADNGAIGGSGSQEFHVIADTGEDALVYCPQSDYAANIEAAEAVAPSKPRNSPTQALTKTATPNKTRCDEVAEFLGMSLTDTVKSIVLSVEKEEGEREIWLLLVRGDHELNEVKAGKLPGIGPFRFASDTEILEHFGSKPGYLGPISIPKSVKIVADRTVAQMSDFICGANEENFHYTGVNWGRDLPEPVVADIRNVIAGDVSPDGKGVLEVQRGIEVGHVFQLGTRYSEDMKASYLDEHGKPQLMQMGCYGIGVTRILGAAIEQNFDAKGIIWPLAIAPFEVVLCPLGYDRSDAVREATESLYALLVEAGIDVILDDRGERPGAMFADWELIGVPHRVVIGERSLKEDLLEYQGRRDETATPIPRSDILSFLRSRMI
jgi:prolyl-tRNA synthetase